MAKRKILMIAPTSFFSDYGGHIRILEETLALQELGNKVTIVTYYKGNPVEGLDIRRTAPLPYRTEYEVGSSRHKLAFDVYLSIKSLRVALKERPDIIHAHMHEGALIGAVLSKLLGIPMVFDFQGSMTAEMVDHKFLQKGGLIFRLLARLERFIDHRADAILTSSNQAQTILQGAFLVPPERIHALPDCVDLKRFNPALASVEAKQRLRAHLQIPEERPIVAYLGLLTDYQGIPHLLHAAKILKESGRPVQFLIMGFPNVDHYMGMARHLEVDDCVTLTGKIPYNEAPYWLSVGDIAVSAKVSATEGSGKLLNYMALAMPIVAYDTPVHREYLAETGIYVPPHDVQGFAEAIGRLAADASKRQEMGQRVYKRVAETFTWSKAAEKINHLYEILI